MTDKQRKYHRDWKRLNKGRLRVKFIASGGQKKRKIWYAKNAQKIKEYNKWYSIKRLYDLEKEDYQAMFEIQKGCCKICGKHQSELEYPLGVDHNHKTGKIRGLLCRWCNFVVGNSFENIEILKKAIEYLKKEEV